MGGLNPRWSTKHNAVLCAYFHQCTAKGIKPIPCTPQFIEETRLALNPTRDEASWLSNFKRNCHRFNAEQLKRDQAARLDRERAARQGKFLL